MYITPLASGLDIRESSTDSLVCVLISGASERHFELGMTLNEGTALGTQAHTHTHLYTYVPIYIYTYYVYNVNACHCSNF